MPRRITNRRLAIRLLAVVLAVGTLFVSALGPFFISRVSAAVDPETAVNLLHLPGVGTPYKVPVGSRPQLTWGTCIGSFAPQPVDITQPVIDSFKNTTAGLGQQSHNFLSDAQLATLQSELNTTQPVIEFKSAQGQDPVANGLAFKLDDTACSQYILYFIGNGTYAMPQFDPVTICSARGCTIDSNHTTRTIFFTQSGPGSNNGTLHYEVPDSSGQLSKTDVTSMVVGGNASGPAGGGGVNIGTITAKWVNAAEIDIVSGGPTTNPKGYNGEVYLKSSWSAVNVNGNPESLYFLAQEGPNADPARSGVVSGNTVECANPIPGGSQIGQQGEGCNGGASNCVPFFEVLEAINYSGSSANDQHAAAVRLNQEANLLPSAKVNYYDYSSSCVGNNSAKNVAMSSNSNALIWFFYSSSQDAFTTVFPEGTANEQQFVGTYGKKGSGVYQGGTKGCALVLADPNGTGAGNGTTKPTTNKAGIFGVVWNTTTNCTTPANNQVNVDAVGGTIGENGFSGTTAPTPTTNADSPKLGCDLLGGLLNWLICPIVSAAQGAAGALDDQINTWLNTDATQVFQSDGAGNNAYYNVWKQFRLIGLSIVALVGLVMVFAQALGSNNAYAIKKTLPRAVVVSVLMPLLWPILKAMGQGGYALGNDVRHLIYAALAPLGGSGNNNIGGGAGYVLTLLGTGGVLAFGVIGLLSFVLTALLAVFVGYTTITLIQIFGILITVASPLFLACAIIEPTKKIFTFGRDSVVAIYIFLPIGFGIVIAVFRSASAAAFSKHSTFSQIEAIILYFAVYPAMATLASRVGGVVSTITGKAQSMTQGAFGGLRNFRKNTAKQRYQDAVNEESALGRSPIGSLYRRAHFARQGGFSPTQGGQARYKANVSRMRRENAAKKLEQDHDVAGGDDLATSLTAQNVSRGEWLDQYAKKFKEFQAGKGIAVSDAVARQRAVDSLGASEAAFGKLGTRSAMVAAANAHLKSNTSLQPTGDDKADMEELLRFTAPLVESGLMTTTDVVKAWKSNPGRQDRAGASFGLTEAMVVGAQQKYNSAKGSDKATVSLIDDDTLHSYRGDILLGAPPGALAGGNWRAIAAMIPEMKNQLNTKITKAKAAQQAEADAAQVVVQLTQRGAPAVEVQAAQQAHATATVNRKEAESVVLRDMGRLQGELDVLAQVAPKSAEVFARGMLDEKGDRVMVKTKDASGRTVEKPKLTGIMEMQIDFQLKGDPPTTQTQEVQVPTGLLDAKGAPITRTETRTVTVGGEDIDLSGTLSKAINSNAVRGNEYVAQIRREYAQAEMSGFQQQQAAAAMAAAVGAGGPGAGPPPIIPPIIR